MPTDEERPASRKLITLRNWCQQANQPQADPLWAKLADEIDNYLHDDDQAETEQSELF